MFNRILLAADGSEHALKATEKIKDLTKNNTDATVEIVYVISGSASKTDVLHHWDTLDIERQQRDRLKQIKQMLTDEEIPFEVKMLHGEPGPTLVAYANDNHFDIFVIGSRGLNTLQEMVLGSVSHKAVKRVDCPVLVVKN